MKKKTGNKTLNDELNALWPLQIKYVQCVIFLFAALKLHRFFAQSVFLGVSKMFQLNSKFPNKFFCHSFDRQQFEIKTEMKCMNLGTEWFSPNQILCRNI